MGSLTRIINLPMPVKMAMFVAGGGSIGAVLWMIPALQPLAYVIWIVTAIGAVAMIAIKLLWKLLDKRKSKPFEQKLGENASTAPSAVSDPGRRARLDDLRKKFSEGVNTFKEHGKDLYSMPWYAIVGEPGSGKTEVIRHCNVGFPPGLQDQLQGAGGTLNMNWWFTNHAVILDTAGRLMFEEVEPGQTSEWNEFLKLLRSARPNCPINGMLLVIPADSLIKDDADTIERKGGKIAQQLDNIQRALGVRFPVFILITKADLINGFREFFDELNDPVLQHQMLGWTNPQPLDAPFDPEQVESHLREVRRRLLKRRMGLLMDPVHSGNQSARRIDEVDAMYAFPDSLVKIAPRLRVYLQMVFVQGAWSTKPLFLRGIYFTSSMRDGAALDADLADALGVDVDDLPEGGTPWAVDRAYFLRDLFINKIFRERGLVTRAANAKGQQRSRRLIIVGAGTLAVVLIAGLTLLGFFHLRQTIQDPAVFWADAAAYFVDRDSSGDDARVDSQAGIAFWDDVTVAVQVRGSQEVGFPPGYDAAQKWNYVSLQAGAVEDIQAGGSNSAIFAVMGLVQGDPFAERNEAQRLMFETAVLRPVVGEAGVRLASGDTQWGPDSTAALTQLVGLEYAAENGSPATETKMDLAAVMRYLHVAMGMSPGDARVAADQQGASELQRILDWTYSSEGGNRAWPPVKPLVLPDTDRALLSDSDALLVQAAERFVAHWSPEGSASESSSDSLYAQLNALERAARAFAAAENELLVDPGFRTASSVEDFETARSAWVARYARLNEARTSLASAVTALGPNLDLSWVQLADLARNQGLSDAEAAYTQVLAAMGESFSRPSPSGLGSLGSRLGDAASGAAGAAAGAADAAAGAADGAVPEGDGESSGGLLSRLRGSRGPSDSDPTTLDRLNEELRAGYAELYASVNTNLGELEATLRDLRQTVLDRPRGATSGRRLFEIRSAAYEQLDREITASVGEVDLASLADRLRGLKPSIADATQRVTGEFVSAGDGPIPAAGRELATAAMDATEGYRANRVIGAGLGRLGSSAVAFEDLVVERAGNLTRDKLLARPAIPGTRSQGGEEYERRYQPAAAEGLFQLLGQVTQYMDNEQRGRLLSRSSLEGRRDEVRQGADEYLRGYLEYWTQEVPYDDAAPRVPNDWAEAVAYLDGINARDVNTRFRSIDEHVIAAIDAVRGVVPEGTRAEVQRIEAAARAEIQKLDRRYTDDTAAVKDNWEDLGTQVSAARSSVLGMRDNAFDRDLLGGLYIGPREIAGPAARYWSSLVLGSLTALSESAERGASEAVRWLQNNGRFPLVLDGEGELNRADLQAARGRLDSVRVGGTIAGRQGTVGDPEFDPRAMGDEVAEQITRLRNAGRSTLNEQAEQLLGRAGAVIDALSGETPVRFRVVVLPPRFQEDRADDFIRYIEVRIDGDAKPEVGGRGAPRYQTSVLNQSHVIDSWVTMPSASNVTLALYGSDGSAPEAQPFTVASLSGLGLWKGLEPVRSTTGAPVPPDRAPDALDNLWSLPIEVDTPGGRKRYWIGVQYDASLPDRDNWPKARDWFR